MDEITLDDKTYVSSKRAAQITGYAKDYVGQLCREGRVDARLVGRNWYVLEDSIRAHRFGAKETESIEVSEPEIPESTPAEAWESTNYVTDLAPELLPTLEVPEKSPESNLLDVQDPVKPLSKPLNTSIVSEMQSAWQDWFSRTNEFEVSREILLEDTALTTQTSSIEEESTPVTLEKVSEIIESRDEALEEEMVPIRRVRPVAQVELQQPSAAPIAVPFDMKGEVRRTRPMYEPEMPTSPVPQMGRIIRERRVIRKKRPSALLQTLLVLVAVAAIVVGVIGSGSADAFLAKHQIQGKPIQYLVGESSFKKASK